MAHASNFNQPSEKILLDLINDSNVGRTNAGINGKRIKNTMRCAASVGKTFARAVSNGVVSSQSNNVSTQADYSTLRYMKFNQLLGSVVGGQSVMHRLMLIPGVLTQAQLIQLARII